MNKIQKLAAVAKVHKGHIIRRTIFLTVTVVGVTIAADLIKLRVKPSSDAVLLVEEAAVVVDGLAETIAKAAE